MGAKRVLIVGADSRGSYQVRGLQLGGAIGARVTTRPVASDWSWAEVVVLLKRAATAWATEARRCQAPLVWDAVDFWTQPDHNTTPVLEHARRARDIAESIGVSTIITATDAMATAIGPPAWVYLPHHSRPGLQPAPRRDRAAVVAYEGQEKYLGTWRRALEQACARLDLAFVVNPPDLRTADVVVAFRGERWDGEVCRQWKSGVKYVNALVAGRPVVTHPTAAFTEIGPVGLAIERATDLERALALAATSTMRDQACALAEQRAHEYSLATIAARFEAILQIAERRAA